MSGSGTPWALRTPHMKCQDLTPPLFRALTPPSSAPSPSHGLSWRVFIRPPVLQHVERQHAALCDDRVGIADEPADVCMESKILARWPMHAKAPSRTATANADWWLPWTPTGTQTSQWHRARRHRLWLPALRPPRAEPYCSPVQESASKRQRVRNGGRGARGEGRRNACLPNQAL